MKLKIYYGLFILLFSLLTHAVYAQHSFDNAEVKKIEKIISRVIKIPSDFQDARKSACFSLKLIFSDDVKPRQMVSSIRVPAGLDAGLYNTDNYSNIDWGKLVNGSIKSGDGLIIVISIYPDDNIEGLPDITHHQVDDLFNFGSVGNAGVSYILPGTLVLPYRQAMK